MSIREMNTTTTSAMHLQAVLSMTAELATEETNDKLAKKNEEKTEKKRAGNKILTAHAPIISGTVAPAKPAATPAVTPAPVVVPIGVLLSNSTSQNAADAQKNETMREIWNKIEAKVQDFNNRQTEQSKLSANSLMEITPPELTPAERKDTVKMVEYMLAILIASIDMAEDQSKVSGQTNTLSQDMVALTQQEAEKAVADLKAEDDYLYKQAHQSFWEKVVHAVAALGHLLAIVCPISCAILLATGGTDSIKKQWSDFKEQTAQSGAVFQDLVSAMMILGGIASGNVGIVAMGIMMLAMSASGGQDDLNNALAKLPLGLKIVAEIAIAVAMAVVLGGVGGILEVAAESGTNAAADGAADGAEEAGSEAGDGAAEAAPALDAAPAADAASSQTTTLDSIKAILKKIAEKSTAGGLKAIASRTIMTAGMVNVYSDIVRSVIKLADVAGAKISQDTEDEASAIGGAVLGVAATLGAALMSSGATASNLAKRLETLFGEKGLLNLQKSLQAFTALFIVAAASQEVIVGFNELKQADIMDDMAQAQAAQNMYGDLLQIVDTMISSNTNTSNAIHSDFAAINSRWDSIFVTPWDAQA